jgi:hypothetical protein
MASVPRDRRGGAPRQLDSRGSDGLEGGLAGDARVAAPRSRGVRKLAASIRNHERRRHGRQAERTQVHAFEEAVPKGTVVFKVTNRGTSKHDFKIGA